MPRRTHAAAAARLAALAAAVALAGCGEDKPGYCADRDALQQSVSDLGQVEVTSSGGLQELRTQLKEVESSARALASSAKDDFPSEAGAIETSVESLNTALEDLPSSPSATDLAAVATSVGAVGTALTDFTDATASNCS